MAQAHKTCGVFVMVQQYFDSDLAISVCFRRKLDVVALRAGKAIEHLELIGIFKSSSACHSRHVQHLGCGAVQRIYLID